MANFQDNPLINYNANLLKQAGTEQYTTGRNTETQGINNLQPVYDYFKKALSGDTTQLMQDIQPEADVVGQQFDQVRSMISDQPRSGGKASTLAELPVEQIKTISNLISQARSGAASGAAGVAGQQIQAGQGETAAGINAAGQSAQIGLEGRQQDLANSWTNFFKQLAGNAAQGAGAALTKWALS